MTIHPLERKNLWPGGRYKIFGQKFVTSLKTIQTRSKTKCHFPSSFIPYNFILNYKVTFFKAYNLKLQFRFKFVIITNFIKLKYRPLTIFMHYCTTKRQTAKVKKKEANCQSMNSMRKGTFTRYLAALMKLARTRHGVSRSCVVWTWLYHLILILSVD